MRAPVVVLLLLTLFAGAANAASWQVHDGFEFVQIEQALPTIAEQSPLLADVLNQNFSTELYQQSNQLTDQRYWYRLQIDNESSQDLPLALIVQSHIIRDLQVFHVLDGKQIEHQQIGLLSTRIGSYRGPRFYFTVPANQSSELYISKQTNGPAILPMALAREGAEKEFNAKLLLFWGMLIGVLLALVGYNAMVYSFNPNPSYLWYLCFQIIAFFEFSCLYGFGYLFIPRELLAWFAQHMTMFNYLLIWSAFMFANHFLNLKQYAPKVHEYIGQYHWFLPIMALPGLYFTEQQMMLVFVPVLLAAIFACFYFGWVAFKAGYQPAIIYLLSWLPLVTGGMVATLTYSNLLPQNLFTLHAFAIGTLFELFLLAIALAKQLKFHQFVEKQLSYMDMDFHLPNRQYFFGELKQQLDKVFIKDYGLKMVLISMSGLDGLIGAFGSSSVMTRQKHLLAFVSAELQLLPWLEAIKPTPEQQFALILMAPDKYLLVCRGSIQIEEQMAQLQSLWQQALDADEYFNNIRVRYAVTMVRDGDNNPAETYRQLQCALLQAEKQGSPWLAFEPSMDEFSLRQIYLLNELKHALSNDELSVYFQPQFDLHTNEVVGAEALLRWHHPQQGLISPVEFIPLAEQSGLIFPMTCWLIEHIFIWIAANDMPLRISINVSVLDLEQEQFIDLLRTWVRVHQIDASLVVFEITETQHLTDSQKILNVLKHLRYLGFKISIDDFGTGYSSMSYLSYLKADEIKVDQSFVHNIESHRVNQTIVKTLLGMANTLDASAVIEGIETEQELEIVKRLGGKIGQGWYWQKAMPKDDFQYYLNQPHIRVRGG